MPTITSRHNPVFKRVRDAIREHAAEIVIEGSKSVDDAIAGGWKPIVVLRRDVDLSSTLFDALAETRSPQDVLALFERPAPADLFARQDTIVIALDGVQDPGNVGTIVRLAAAFDAGGIALLPGCADPYSPKSIRASAGAILNVPIANVTIDDLPWPLFVTAADGAPDDPPAHGAIIVFGSEGQGVSPEIARRAKSLAIRTSGRVESLNVAASAAILLSRSFEMRGRT
jgi:TrmH family RNA methyltransferase